MLNEYLWIPELETKRLILRKLTPDDVEDLREWLGLDIVYKYWGRPANKEEKNPELMFIDPRPHVKRKPSHDVENDRLGKIAYRVDPARWNQGICTEALTKVVDFIFSETALDRLHAEADVENTASNAVLKKCGFTHEGCIRNGKMAGSYCTYNIYGYIRDDFKSQRA